MTKKLVLALACLCLLPLKGFARPSDPVGTDGGGNGSSLAASDRFTGESIAIVGAYIDGQGTLTLQIASDSKTSAQARETLLPLKEIGILSPNGCSLNSGCRGTIERAQPEATTYQIRTPYLYQSDQGAERSPVQFQLSDIRSMVGAGVIKVFRTEGGNILTFFDLSLDRWLQGMNRSHR
jgi:hypothetical protein